MTKPISLYANFASICNLIVKLFLGFCKPGVQSRALAPGPYGSLPKEICISPRDVTMSINSG